MDHDPTPHHFGSRLCLGFANSILWRRSARPRELLTAYELVLEFLEEDLGALPSPQAAALRRLAAQRPDDAARTFEHAIELRESLFRLLSAVAAGSRAPADDLELLNRWLAAAGAHGRVEPVDGGFAARDRDAEHDLAAPLWPVARSAAALLLDPSDRARLKQCPGPDCGWLFVDESRNRTRRWCDAGLCGNRARVKSHYERSKANRRPSADR